MSIDLAALSDGELADLTLAGRERAFAEIMRRHRDAVYRIANANVHDADEALNLTQETFVSAYRALRHYDAERPMRGWLARIALNKTRDWARRRAVRRLFSFALPHDAAESLADTRPLPDAETFAHQELERVRSAISDLPSSLREPLVLHAIEGMSQAQVAAVLNVTEKAVETRLRRARISLNSALAAGR